MKFVHTDGASEPNGHYSQGVLLGNLLLISHQLPSLNNAHDVPIERQVDNLLSAILSITEAAGGQLESIAQVIFRVVDLNDWGALNQAFSSFMGSHKPARSVIAVPQIKGGWRVSADAISYIE